MLTTHWRLRKADYYCHLNDLPGNYILLRREGLVVNHKRVYRLYREEGLSLRLKRQRR